MSTASTDAELLMDHHGRGGAHHPVVTSSSWGMILSALFVLNAQFLILPQEKGGEVLLFPISGSTSPLACVFQGTLSLPLGEVEEQRCQESPSRPRVLVPSPSAPPLETTGVVEAGCLFQRGGADCVSSCLAPRD